MPLVSELAETYLTACAVEGKSPNTIRGYRQSLVRLQEVAETRGLPTAVEDFTVPQVYQYLGALREHGMSRAYQHRLHREVKAFFSWCLRMGVIEQNVFARVPLVKLEQQIVQPFSVEQVQRLLGAVDLKTRAGRRNHALMLFLLDTGVRASECVSVYLDDVDWEHGRVRVLHGKGQKQRWVGARARGAGGAGDLPRRPGLGGGAAVPLDALRAGDGAARAEHDPGTRRGARWRHEGAPTLLGSASRIESESGTVRQSPLCAVLDVF